MSSQWSFCLCKESFTLPAGNVRSLWPSHYCCTWVQLISTCLCLPWTAHRKVMAGHFTGTHNCTQAPSVLFCTKRISAWCSSTDSKTGNNLLEAFNARDLDNGTRRVHHPHAVIAAHTCTWYCVMCCLGDGEVEDGRADHHRRQPTLRTMSAICLSGNFERWQRRIIGGFGETCILQGRITVLLAMCSDYAVKCWCYRYMNESLLWVVLLSWNTLITGWCQVVDRG